MKTGVDPDCIARSLTYDPEAHAANRRYLAARATALRAALAVAEAEVARLAREVEAVERELRLSGGAEREP